MKTTRLSDKLTLSRNNSSRSVFSRNNNNRLASRRDNSNNEVNRFGISGNDIEHAKKSEKLSKLENQKAKKRLSLKIWLSQEKDCQKVGI